MQRRFVIPFLLLGLMIAVGNCSSQDEPRDRQPAVAGQFYPAGKQELTSMLGGLFQKAARPAGERNVLAIIAPHAGYVFSGEVAASGFNQIDPLKEYDNIFILGPSHHLGFDGASVYPGGKFLTPLGAVKINARTSQALMKKSSLFTFREDAHAQEHSVEVEVPFLQYVMKKDFAIVPIVLGTDNPGTCKRIAEVLRPYFNSHNLFVISTDFSHYPSYADANIADRATAEGILSNSPETLLRVLDDNSAKGVGNLVTSMCGWPCVLTLLYMTQNDPRIAMNLVEYRNSGDAPGGSRDQVVGYCAITVAERAGKDQGFQLTPADRKTLLGIARSTVASYVRTRTIPEVTAASLPEALTSRCGAFVTLQKHGELRGCIGRFDAQEPLYRMVQEMAAAAATEDTRFNPVEAGELNELDIEISVLTPMRKIDSIGEIEMGKHGIYIRKGGRAGTFLPQVAKETGWTREEFLGHCAQDKAGIGWDGWKNADIFVYEALVFGENDPGQR